MKCFKSAVTHNILAALLVAVLGTTVYVAVGIALTPRVQALYPPTSDIVYAPGHFNDARQYALICIQGYYIPYHILPTVQVSRINWMPIYPLAQCALHHLVGVSMVYAGAVVSTLSIGIALFLGSLTLANLGIAAPSIHALAALLPPIGAAWLYLPGAEAIYLAVGMAVMWLITLPLPATPDEDILPRRIWLRELAVAAAGVPVGFVFILTKPNALAMLLPLAFAFFYLSWQRSRAAGYNFGLWTFIADVVIEHLPRRLQQPPEARPVRYVWTPALVAAGILLGFAYWLAYTSVMSGTPFYFMQQQLTVWGRAWYGGNIEDMLLYFLQAFRQPDIRVAWRYNAAWNLAANISALVPAASPRVPMVVRGMLPLMLFLLVYSGAVHGSDRYILSTALAAIGWACWLAPQRPVTSLSRVRALLRWAFVIALAATTFYLLTAELWPKGEPQAWGLVER